MGTSAGGLPWPDGTAKVMDGDNAIRALAEKVDTTKNVTAIYSGRPLGTLGNMGAWVAGRVVQTYAGYGVLDTDSNGIFTVPVPASAVCVSALFVTPFVQGSENTLWAPVVRLDQGSSLSGIRVIARKLDTGGALPSTRIGYAFTMHYQGAW